MKQPITEHNHQGIFGKTYLYKTTSGEEFFLKKVDRKVSEDAAVYFSKEFREEMFQFWANLKDNKTKTYYDFCLTYLPVALNNSGKDWANEIASGALDTELENITPKENGKSRIILNNSYFAKKLREAHPEFVYNAFETAKDKIEKERSDFLEKFSRAIHRELTDTMKEEFVSLEIMNLLGLKTPTELALIAGENGELTLLKRKVADKEDNKIIGSKDRNFVDHDWFTRRDFVLRTLGISDLYIQSETNSARITYPKESSKADRFVDYDPLLEMENPLLSKEKFIDDINKILGKSQTETEAALGKVKFYFEQNKQKINSVAELINNETVRNNLLSRVNCMEQFLADIPAIEIDETKSRLARKVKLALKPEELVSHMDKAGIGFSGKTNILGHYVVSNNLPTQENSFVKKLNLDNAKSEKTFVERMRNDRTKGKSQGGFNEL